MACETATSINGHDCADMRASPDLNRNVIQTPTGGRGKDIGLRLQDGPDAVFFIPSFAIRDRSVLGCMSRIAAAP